MGVKTDITLKELNTLFEGYSFTKIIPTASGIIDTTYIVHTKTHEYILKYFERDIQDRIDADKKLLKSLKQAGLNVSEHLQQSHGWHIYTKLKGKEIKLVKTFHIQALARFMASMHLRTYKQTNGYNFLDAYDIKNYLIYTKKSHFLYYKKLSFLNSYKHSCDGVIHGDIFKDNTLFDGSKIAVFDFIDAGCGSFVFDIAVALVGFGIKKDNNLFINLFLNTYNQRAIKKITKQELLDEMGSASGFYALLRIQKDMKRAKELL